MQDKPVILIVHDDIEGSEGLRQVLQQSYQSAHAAGGPDAIEWLQTHSTDLIILIGSSDLNVVALCEGLDKRAGEAPVIVIATSDGPKIRAFEFEAVDYLVAPVSAEELLARVKIHLDHSRQRRLLTEKNNELERAHKQLSGMAQMATSVLHNVGNVINSLNISADLAAGHVQQLQLSALSKLADMLGEHSDEHGNAIWGEKFRKLPGYLRVLSETYDSRRQAGLKELAALREKMEHVKAIIAMQQGYARGGGSPETVKLSRLVEDSIELNAGYLAEDLVLEREFADDPEILVEKNRAVLILVNLLRNARQSCERSGIADKRIVISLARLETGHAAIHISDNGTGVPVDNVNRLFEFGFTTRKDGHGFGLNSSQKTAIELGGTLALTGNETGRGATFTLTLPDRPPTAAPEYEI